MKLFRTFEELKAAEGAELGTSDWLVVDQDRIDRFAEATGDFQWIHVDPERAAEGPYGRTIAHGWLSASLLPQLVSGIYKVEAKMGVNYGLNKLRFPAPVPVGSKIRATSSLKQVTQVGEAVELVVQTTVHCEGNDKPSVAAETVSRYYL
ncbi:MaoC family dehydratase [Nonomuraea wenchangensis]|uniref:MaoC family dehydratase n=1 Tax=Nonomuraea wenchangensis TaxID=568860 RepID=UPI003443F3E4